MYCPIFHQSHDSANARSDTKPNELSAKPHWAEWASMVWILDQEQSVLGRSISNLQSPISSPPRPPSPAHHQDKQGEVGTLLRLLLLHTELMYNMESKSYP